MMSSHSFGVTGSLPRMYLLTASILFLASRSTGRWMASFQSRASFSPLPLPFWPPPSGAVVAGTGCPCAERVRPRTIAKKRKLRKARERRKGDIVRVLDRAGREWWNRDYPGRQSPLTGENQIMLRGRYDTGPAPRGRSAVRPIVVDEWRGRG